VHQEKVKRTKYTKTADSGLKEVEAPMELLARVNRCGVEPEKLAILRQKLKAHSYGQSGQNPNKLFKHFDRDNTNELDFDEFKAAVRKGGRMTYHHISDRELQKLFASLDTDGDNEVNVEELTAFVWGKAEETPPETLKTKAKAASHSRSQQQQQEEEGEAPRPTGVRQPAAVAPEADVRSSRAARPSAAAAGGGVPYESTAAEDALQTAAALSQAGVPPAGGACGGAATAGSTAEEWRRQQLEDAAESGFVPSYVADDHQHQQSAWGVTGGGDRGHYGAAAEEEGVTYIEASGGYANADSYGYGYGYGSGEDPAAQQEHTTYIDSSGSPMRTVMRVAAPAPEPEPQQQQQQSDGQRFVKSGIGRQGMSMRQMRRRAGVDTKGRPPAKKEELDESEVLREAQAPELGPAPQLTNPPPQQSKPRVDKVSSRSVRLRWSGEYGTNQGTLDFFLYRSAYRNTGERVADSVVEIECGQEETWVDAFGSKDQLASQYGYVLIACNERGEFSKPSPVAMVKPKKEDTRPHDKRRLGR
jgi:hypothetical protein